MRFVLTIIAVLGLGPLGFERADAQYPIYAPQTYAPVVQDYDDHYDDHYDDDHHQDHYYTPAPTHYSGYAAVPAYPQYVPSVSVPLPSISVPSVSYSPVYSDGALGYVQPVIPQSPVYYSNNYYGQPAYTHHRWHPGHYLRGHH